MSRVNKYITLAFISIFSIVLWGFVSFSEEYFTTLKLPVRFVNLPADYAIGSQDTEEISVSIRGEGWQLAKHTFGSTPSFIVNVNKKNGLQSVSLISEAEQNSWLTSSLQLVEIEPTKIEFLVEKIDTKMVPIVPNIGLDYKDGYGLVSEITFEPDSVRISGPASQVSETEAVVTRRYEFENVDRPFNDRIDLEAAAGITLNRNNTRIEFDVQKIVDKTFSGITVETRSVPPSRELQLIPAKIDIVLRGGINILGKLNQSDMSIPYVHFRQAIDDTTGALEPQIEVPPFTTLIDVKPARIEYIIKQY